jgi:UDP-N-acetylmuramoyl-L-alanyl-D-glutamate--2,6-diaminopimelate ligase
MNLQKLIAQIPLIAIYGNENLEINTIQFDSRQIGEGDVFVATQGTQVDGHNFIEKAIAAGQKLLFAKICPKHLLAHITYIHTPDSAEALWHYGE